MSSPSPSPEHPAGWDGQLIARLRAAGCVFAEDEAELLLAHPVDAAERELLIRRRIAGDPLEIVLGWAEFLGLRIDVGPGVFVPRRRSELLVSSALGILQGRLGVVVDLCCGSGAIGAALLARHPALGLYASDIDENAVACARRNIEPRGGRVFSGDLFDALPPSLRGEVDLIVVNAPYVPTDEVQFMPPEARDWEPMIALDGGGDGLDVHRRIVSASAAWLKPGGHLIIETSERQLEIDQRMFESASLSTRSIHDDDLDATVVIGTVPAETQTPNGRLLERNRPFVVNR